ncbi:hypothetical protein [Erythrobacter aureus]
MFPEARLADARERHDDVRCAVNAGSGTALPYRRISRDSPAEPAPSQ